MPTSTFFRLPQEKRLRLTEAAWEEFTKVDYASASINKIIQEAHIPRGSFYQYFADKEELFRYLLGGMRKDLVAGLRTMLDQTGGDLYGLPLAIFDRFVSRRGSPEPAVRRCIRVMQLNKSMDLQWMLDDRRCLFAQEIRERARLDVLREQDEEYVQLVFSLLVAVLAVSIMEALSRPEEREEQRRRLESRVKIIQYGSAALVQQAEKEEPHGE